MIYKIIYVALPVTLPLPYVTHYHAAFNPLTSSEREVIFGRPLTTCLRKLAVCLQ